MFQLVENITFKQVRNAFQDKLRRDVKSINPSKKVLVFADKTRRVQDGQGSILKAVTKKHHEDITESRRQNQGKTSAMS